MARRTLVYCIACLLFTVLPILLGRVIQDPSQLFFHDLWPFLKKYSLFFTCLLLLMPLVVYDVLRVTNRVVGPVCRLRRELQTLADGGTAQPLSFREGDSWIELAPLFNTVLERVERLEREHVEPCEPTETAVNATADAAPR